jgi:hypothetical protein
MDGSGKPWFFGGRAEPLPVGKNELLAAPSPTVLNSLNESGDPT